MEITIEREYDFTPTWNENNKDPSPVVFHMRRLTTAQRDKLIDYSVDSDGKALMHVDRQGLFLNAVKRIEKLSVNGEAITQAKDFLERPGLSVLLSEVVGNIIAENGKADLKNS